MEVRDLRALSARSAQWQATIDYLYLTQTLMPDTRPYSLADIVRRYGFAQMEIDCATHRHTEAMTHSGHDPVTGTRSTRPAMPAFGMAQVGHPSWVRSQWAAWW